MSFATFPNSQRPSPQTPTPRPGPITKSPNAATTTFAQRQARQPFRAQPKPVNKVDPMQAQYDQMKNVPMAPPPGPLAKNFPGMPNPSNPNPSFGGGKGVGMDYRNLPMQGSSVGVTDPDGTMRMVDNLRPVYGPGQRPGVGKDVGMGYRDLIPNQGLGGLTNIVGNGVTNMLGNKFGGLGSMVGTAANNALQNSLQAPQPFDPRSNKQEPVPVLEQEPLDPSLIRYSFGSQQQPQPFNQNPNPTSNMGGGGMPQQTYNGQLDLSGMMRPDAQAAGQSQMDFFNQGQQAPQNMAQMGANASSTGGKSTSGPSSNYSAFGGGKSR